jgi:hypothetical protein
MFDSLNPSNILRTDGVDLEFIFLKPKHETVAPKTPAQYRNWLLMGVVPTPIVSKHVDQGVLPLVWVQPSQGAAPTI